MMKQVVALAGNPNAGKTSLFNVLTGTRQYVGNWAGVTVEKKEGKIKELPDHILVDLPGVYSLSAQSLEEKIALSYLLEETPGKIVNIVDASNLERNLYFSVQLLEMGIPCILALNMMDVAEKRGMKIHIPLLEKHLGTKVIPIVARKSEGHQEIVKHLQNDFPSKPLVIQYPERIEHAIKTLTGLFSQGDVFKNTNVRWLAVQWLERNEQVEETIQSHLSASILDHAQQVRQSLGDHTDLEIRKYRYQWIEHVINDVVSQNHQAFHTLSDQLDRWFLHPFLGVPIFFGMIYLTFQITFNWIGAYLSDLLDSFMSGTLTDALQSVLLYMNSPEWFTQLMTNGVLAGVGGVLVFVPQIVILFLCLSFLEDSGYMARAAVLTDRLMSRIGLNGKAFIPLIIGFGCNVPAIMATRTLEDSKGRLVTSLIAPFMSCSARLSVYSLFVPAFFPSMQGEVVFLLYVTGILMAIITAFLLKKFILLEGDHFLLELPPYRTLMVKSLLLHTWDKTKGFVRKAGTIIFGMSVLIWFLGHFSLAGYGSMDTSFLADIGNFIAPLFSPMNFATWQAGVALITGLLAKEVVVSTMSIAYGVGDGGTTLSTLLHGAFSVPSALAFLFFVLLYTPCISTVAMMKRETGSWKWTTFSMGYSFLVAWIVSFIVYQVSYLFIIKGLKEGISMIYVLIVLVLGYAGWQLIQLMQRVKHNQSNCCHTGCSGCSSGGLGCSPRCDSKKNEK